MGTVLAIRFADRFGKGVRGAPRGLKEEALVYKKLAYCVTTITLLLVGCGTAIQIPATNQTDNVSSAPPSPQGARLMENQPKHIVIVIEENLPAAICHSPAPRMTIRSCQP